MSGDTQVDAGSQIDGTVSDAASGGDWSGDDEDAGADGRRASALGERADAALGKVSERGSDSDAGADEGVDLDAGSVSAAGIARDLADALCNALEDCLGQQKLLAVFGREDCRQRLRAQLVQDDFARLAESVDAGRVSLHPEALADCYRDTAALGCAVQTQRLPASCQRAIAGHVALGQACTAGADCAGAAYCPLADCPHVCTALGSNGADCLRDEECEVGLVCLSGRCGSLAESGDACAGSSEAICPFGQSCFGSTDTQAGVCKDNAEIQVGELDASCTPGGTLCREGLSCTYDGASGFHCEGPVERDASCKLALPTQCPADQYCDAPDLMSVGSCRTLPGDGEPCVHDRDCAPAHVCVSEAGAAICRRIGDLGDACSSDALCRSGACLDGRCGLRPTCQ